MLAILCLCLLVCTSHSPVSFALPYILCHPIFFERFAEIKPSPHLVAFANT